MSGFFGDRERVAICAGGWNERQSRGKGEMLCLCAGGAEWFHLCAYNFGEDPPFCVYYSVLCVSPDSRSQFSWLIRLQTSSSLRSSAL